MVWQAGRPARPHDGTPGAPVSSYLRPQVRRDDPLNLSISVSGGKETNKDSPSSGERRGKSPSLNPRARGARGNCGVWKAGYRQSTASQRQVEATAGDGASPVGGGGARPGAVLPESGCLGMQPKAGGKLHLRLNSGTGPIADKYREGKLKRTLKREFKSA